MFLNDQVARIRGDYIGRIIGWARIESHLTTMYIYLLFNSRWNCYLLWLAGLIHFFRRFLILVIRKLCAHTFHRRLFFCNFWKAKCFFLFFYFLWAFVVNFRVTTLELELAIYIRIFIDLRLLNQLTLSMIFPWLRLFTVLRALIILMHIHHSIVFENSKSVLAPSTR